jgi:hypothetical protein
MVRLCVLLAFLIGPLLSEFLDGTLSVPGVRLTLWLAGLVIIGAGVLAAVSFRAARRAGESITS